MALIIEHPEAERLARAVTELTGETLTEAVLNALRERLERETARRGLRENLHRIQRGFADARRTDVRSTDEIIGYDNHGLPA